MKRRNRKRKRSSKAVTPAETPLNVEKPVSPSGISRDAESLVRSPNIAIAAEDLAGCLDITSEAEQLTSSPSISYDAEDLASSPSIARDAENPAVPSVALAEADRRVHPRYEFTAAAEVVPGESGLRIATRVRDLSQQGCYVDTSDALPLGTVTDVRVKKGAQLFEARARVVYSRAAKG